MRGNVFRYLIIGALGFLFACREQQAREVASEKANIPKPEIVSVNYPLHFFTQRIGDFSVESIYLPGDSTLNSDILENTDIFFLNGTENEQWISHMNLPPDKIINTSAPFQDRYILNTDNSYSTNEVHSTMISGKYAYTTWLDLKNAESQANTIYLTLRALYPSEEPLFTSNYVILTQEIDSLDSDLKKILDPFIGATLFSSKPVYQYLGSGYGLSVKSVDWDQEISDLQWGQFLEMVRPGDLKLMLWETNPPEKIAAKLDSAGFRIVVFKPCSKKPEEHDFIEQMKLNVNNLMTGLSIVDLNP